MSVQDAPSNITNTFNNTSFITSELSNSASGITVEEGLNYFLGYPVSQGSESINGTLVATSIECSNINGGDSNVIQIGGDSLLSIEIGATVICSQTISIGVNEDCDGDITLGCSTRNINLNGETTINQNLISNSQTITPTQLGYVSGATSNLQNQLTILKSFPEIYLNGTLDSDLTLINGTTSNVFAGGSLAIGFYNILLQTNISINDSTTTLTTIFTTIQIGSTLIYTNGIFSPSNGGTLMGNGSNVLNLTNFTFYNPTLNAVIQVSYKSSYSGSTVSPTIKSSSASTPTFLTLIRLS